MAAEDAADACGLACLDRGDVQAELEARVAATGTQTTLSPKIVPVSASPSAAVAIAMPESGCRWSTCGGVHQAVHRGVDRRRRAALAVQAVVERRHHLVLAVHPRVDVDQGTQPVQPQHRQPGLGQRAEVAAGTLDPQQFDVGTGHRVDLRALGRGVAAGVVGVPRISAQPVGPCASEVRPTTSCGHVSSILPGCRRPGRPRSGPGTRWPGTPRIGSRGQARAVAPVGQVGSDVGVEGVHQDLVGGQHVPGPLGHGQRLGVHEQRPRGHLLHVEHRADLAGDLLLDVVALVEHERDAAAGSVAAAADHLVRGSGTAGTGPPRRRSGRRRRRSGC